MGVFMKRLYRVIIDKMRKYDIRTRIIAMLVLCLLVYCLTITQMANLFSRKLIDGYVNEYVKSTQEELVSSIQMIIEQVNMLTIRLRSNSDIYNAFGQDGQSEEQKQQKFRNILQNTILDDQKIGDISIIIDKDGDKEIYSYKSIIEDYSEPYLNKISKSIMPVLGDMIQDSHGNFYLPFGIKMRNFYTGEDIGYLIMYIKEQALCNIYENLVDEWGYSFIISDQDIIISHSDKQKVGKVMLDTLSINGNGTFQYKSMEYNGTDSIVATYKFNESLKNIGVNWGFVSIIKQDELFKIIKQVNFYVSIIMIVMFLIGSATAIFIIMRITRPISRLSSKVNSFGSGNLSEEPIQKQGDEIWELEKSFNKMVININDLIEKNNMEKEKQRQMELTALQAQINPHFLYNTLDAIGWIAKLKKQNDIELLVMELAKFFRLSLHKGDKFITVEEEIQLVKSFATIELMRHPNKFEIIYNIQEEMKEFKVLKIILQPLVENAIKHGIGQKRGKGEIVVNGTIDGDDLCFEVIDNGIGFIVEKTAEERYEGRLKSGYGFRNVDERIKIEYGQQYGLSIESELDKGTKVIIRLRTRPLTVIHQV